jgi:hypothetical protein
MPALQSALFRQKYWQCVAGDASGKKLTPQQRFI